MIRIIQFGFQERTLDLKIIFCQFRYMRCSVYRGLKVERCKIQEDELVASKNPVKIARTF